MDLLGGYGSDNTSTSSSGDEDNTTPFQPPSFVSQPPTSAAASLSESSKPAESSRQTRGKRLVSLHAVLPTHILEQLTKSTATGGLDSEEEEEEVASRPTKDSKRHATVIGKDEGLSSFLSELKSAPTLTFLGGTAAETKPASSQPLGQAFTTTQTVIVSRARNAEIINVHEMKQPEPPAPQVKPFVSERSTETTQKPFAARPASPLSSASVSVPRPGMNRPIVSAPLAAMTTEQPGQQFAQYQPEPEESIDPRLAKKRSRKEMEKALRAGNLEALQGVTTTVEAQGSTYTPQEETYRVPISGITKVAPVSMYDPKAGSDVMQTGATGKQRGKHQINTLLASAASLELQRARAIGTSGGKGKRADAKRKYGW